MKTLSFSVKEILPSLLDKKKTQTIRPLKPIFPPIGAIRGRGEIYEYKKPRFKVGEQVRLYWNQRSKDKYFCFRCGKGLGSDENTFSWHSTCVPMRFHKFLGEVEITEVFEIVMFLDNEGLRLPRTDKQEYNVSELIEKDGFKDALGFLNYFSTNYDLYIPRRFATYRWRWL